MTVDRQATTLTEHQLPFYYRQMAEIITRYVPTTADWQTSIPDLTFFRRDEVMPHNVCLIEPSVVVVVQGVKELLIGGDAYSYDSTQFLITSLNLPANSAVINATPNEPCLGFWIKLDLRLLAELIAQGHMPLPANKAVGQSVGLGSNTVSIIEPFSRLLRLTDEPDAIEIMAPLIYKEIHYRLLLSDQSALLRHIASIDSQGYRISKAIDWLKVNYRSSLRVDDLASRVQMSSATFHHHFKQLTAMSPLQYQKWLRLNEAKRLMLNEHKDAASAAFQVGYESPSQFSREYSRLFGAPPKRDIDELRRQSSAC